MGYDEMTAFVTKWMAYLYFETIFLNDRKNRTTFEK